MTGTIITARPSTTTARPFAAPREDYALAPLARFRGLLTSSTAWSCSATLVEALARVCAAGGDHAPPANRSVRRAARAIEATRGRAPAPRRRGSADDEAARLVDLEAVDDALAELVQVRAHDALSRGVHRRCVAVVARALEALAPHGITSDVLRAVARHRWSRFERDGRPWLTQYRFHFATVRAAR